MVRFINGNRFRVLSSVCCTLFLVAGIAAAAGTGESPSDLDAGDPVLVAENTATQDVTSAMKDALEEIGIRTFRAPIESVNFELEKIDGTGASLADYRGDFILLNFWATWCPPCREEMPSMQRVHELMDGRPFRIIAINLQEDDSTVLSFVNEFGYDFPVLLDRSGAVALDYSVRGIPTSYFIAPDGTMLGMLVGTRYWDEPEVLGALERIVGLVEG